MTPGSIFSDIKQAFSRPFKKENKKNLITAFILMLIPCLGFIAESMTFGYAASSQLGSAKKNVKNGMKILIVTFIHSLPAVFFYYLLKFIYGWMPQMYEIVLVVLAGFTLYFTVRAVLLIPIAACSVILGAPVKIASDPKEMMAVLSGCIGKYILAMIFGVLLLLPFAIAQYLPGIVAYIFMALYAVVYYYITSSIVMGCVLTSLGAKVEYTKPAGSGSGIGALNLTRMTSFVLSLILIVSTAVAPVSAAGGLYGEEPIMVHPGDGAAGNIESEDHSGETYKEAYERFASSGVLNFGDSLEYDQESRKYYITSGHERDTETAVAMLKGGGVIAVEVADIALDFVPAVSNIKNAIQTVYYGAKAGMAKTEQERDEALSTAGFKAAGIALGCFGKLSKAASGLTGGIKNRYIAYMIGHQPGELAGDAAGAVAVLANDAVTGLAKWLQTNAGRADKFGNFLNYTGIVSWADNKIAALNERDEGYLPWVDTGKFITGVKALGDIIATTPQDVADTFKGFRNPFYVVPADENVILIISSANVVSVPGRYSGTLSIKPISAYGATITFTDTPVYVTIEDDLSFRFSTKVVSNMVYDLGQVGTSNDSTTTIKYEGGEFDLDENTHQLTADFKILCDAVTTTNYEAFGYSSGSLEQTVQVEYTVELVVGFDSHGKPVVSGKMTSKNVLTEEELAAMAQYGVHNGSTVSFTCNKQ